MSVLTLPFPPEVETDGALAAAAARQVSPNPRRAVIRGRDGACAAATDGQEERTIGDARGNSPRVFIDEQRRELVTTVCAMSALKMGRELMQRKRTYPDVWQLGENLAEDRFDIIPGEDRRWDPSMVDDYLREVAEDTVKLVEATGRRQGVAPESGALATVGMACSYTLEPVLREYIRTGAAADDTAAISTFRDDYDRGRQMAERGFFPEPETWLAMSPLIASGIELHIDGSGFALVFALNATTPPFDQPGVAKGGYLARMAELIRHYIQPANADDLRVRSERAAAWLTEYTKVHAEVVAEFRAAGNYSGADMSAETRRRMEALGRPSSPD
jgi:hypothetical protein